MSTAVRSARARGGRSARDGLPAGVDRSLVVFIAVAVTCIEAGARALIAWRIGASFVNPLVAAPVAFVLAFVALDSARLVGPGALSTAVPMVGLLVIGDIVVARLTQDALTLSSEYPVLFGVAAFVATLAIVDEPARLRAAGPLMSVAGICLIAAPRVPGLSAPLTDQYAFVDVAGQQLIPGELGRLLVLLGLASTLSELPLVLRERRSWIEVRHVVARAAIAPTLAVAIHVVEKDLGPAVLLALAAAGTIAVAVGRPRWFVVALGVATAGVVVASIKISHVHDRLLDVARPLRHVTGNVYDQAGLAHLALAWGGWRGVGFGAGLSAGRDGAVPAAGTDYVLAQWSLEAGLIGLLVAMALLIWLVSAAWSRTLAAPIGFPRIASSALSWLLTVSAIWTTGAVLGLLPLSGLPTPFVSGASNAIAMAVLAGLLCRFGQHPERAVMAPGPAISAVRVAALVTMVTITALAVHQIAAERTALNRRLDNPWRKWAALDRGRILARGGETLAWTTGRRSLDTVHRSYAHPELASGVIGRIDYAHQSGGGVEDAWRATLRCGSSGQAQPRGAAWEAGSTEVHGDPARCKPADLRTTLDLDVITAAQRALGARLGAVVVMDARSGAILGLAGHIGDVKTQSPAAPLTLRAAPGSTFKIVTATAVLAAGVPPETSMASGYLTASGSWLPNAGSEICGGTLIRAFAESCNSSFAQLGDVVGAARLTRSATRFGFGSPMSVSGLRAVPSQVGVGLDRGAGLASASIGQGTVVATPLEMAVVASTIASGGLLLRPLIVDAVCGRGEVMPSARRVLSAEVADRLRDAMRAVTTSGTGRAAAATEGSWALKTGTAELPALRQTGSVRGTAGWIVGFPTAATADGPLPVVAGIVLPDRAAPDRSGPQDGVALIKDMAPTLLHLSQPKRCR